MAGSRVSGREDMTRAKPPERRQRILDRVLEYDSVTVDDLADEFGLTKMSVRRDLNALAENGQVVRVEQDFRGRGISTVEFGKHAIFTAHVVGAFYFCSEGRAAQD